MFCGAFCSSHCKSIPHLDVLGQLWELRGDVVPDRLLDEDVGQGLEVVDEGRILLRTGLFLLKSRIE